MQVEQDYDPLEMEYSEKHMALAKFLGGDPEDIHEDSDSNFSVGSREYLVLDDDEADQEAFEYMRQNLWAFTPEFVAAYTPEGVDAEIIQVLQERAEDANEAIARLVGKNLDDMFEDAMRYDGRGHFISHYDGNENEEGDFFIYRIN